MEPYVCTLLLMIEDQELLTPELYLQPWNKHFKYITFFKKKLHICNKFKKLINNKRSIKIFN